MSEILNIAICGLVSSGKSSLLNALSSLFISSSSKNRDTFCPTLYELRTNGNVKNGLMLSKKVNEMKLNNKKNFEEFNQSNKDIETKSSIINEENLGEPIKAKFDANIVDFPGFGDIEGCSKDGKTDFFLNSLLNNSAKFDLILFVCDANSPFLTKEQMNIFNKIKEQLKINLDEKQIYTELFVVAIKYDCDGDEEVDEMWKDKHISLGIPKENIFFVSNYQLFVSNMCEFIYLPDLCKQEFINIYKFICGNKKRPIHIDVCNKKCKNKCTKHICNKIIKRQHFISDENAVSDTNGDKNGLIDRLKTLNNGLNDRRTEPFYNKLIKILTDICDTMCPYSIIQDDRLNELFAENSLWETSTIKFDIIDLCKNTSYLYNSTTSLIQTPSCTFIYDKILISILCKQYLQKNIPYSIHQSIKSKIITPLKYSLRKYNKEAYQVLDYYIKYIANSKSFYKKYIEYLKTNILSTKCIITCQFLMYFYESTLIHYKENENIEDVESEEEELNFMTKYVKHIYSKAIKCDINYIYLLSDCNKNYVTKILSVTEMLRLVIILRGTDKYEGLNMNFESFKYDKEYSIIVGLTKVTFHQLKYLKFIQPETYDNFKKSISANLFKRIEYCLANITEKVFNKEDLINGNKPVYPIVYTYTESKDKELSGFIELINNK